MTHDAITMFNALPSDWIDEALVFAFLDWTQEHGLDVRLELSDLGKVKTRWNAQRESVFVKRVDS